jgi:hypothetical protein
VLTDAGRLTIEVAGFGVVLCTGASAPQPTPSVAATTRKRDETRAGAGRAEGDWEPEMFRQGLGAGREMVNQEVERRGMNPPLASLVARRARSAESC